MGSLVIALMAVAVVAVSAAPAEFDFNNIESIDVAKFFSDENRKKAAFECLMDTQPCGEMQPLRDTLPRIIETKCSDCTPRLKDKYYEVNKYLLENHPEEYTQLALRYSPKSK